MNEQVPAPVIPVLAFSYASVEPEAATIARTAAAAIRTTQHNFFREIGAHLLRAKEALPHGRFTQWAEAELGINARTARNYMQAATWLEGKAETVAALPPAIVYALSSPSAPAELVQEVVKASAGGGALDADSIRDQLAQRRTEEAELRREQQRKPNLTKAEVVAKQAKIRQRREREREKERAEGAAATEAAEARVRPVVDELIACPGELGRRLAEIMASGEWRLSLALRETLYKHYLASRA